jgi:hypothetical protein
MAHTALEFGPVSETKTFEGDLLPFSLVMKLLECEDGYCNTQT